MGGLTALCVATMLALAVAEPSQQQTVPLPPIPFEDPGACPFEGCVYREWTTNAAVSVRQDRKIDAPVAFTLPGGEKVTAVTGVVITVKPMRVEFIRPATIKTSDGDVRMDTGETLYMLTYLGEGFAKAWIKGKLYADVDTVEFYNGVCDYKPERCAGKIVEKSVTEWWVQIRDRQGRVGWTNAPERFDGKNAIGGFEEPGAVFRVPASGSGFGVTSRSRGEVHLPVRPGEHGHVRNRAALFAPPDVSACVFSSRQCD